MSDFIDDYLNKADPSDLRNVVRAQAINVNELQRRTLNVTTLDQITPRVGTRLDQAGHVGLIRLNRVLVFNTQATPTVKLPPDALTESNILEIVLTGEIFHAVGSTQTITPRFYIGKSGSETLVTSDTAVSVPNMSARRTFFYTIRVSAAPQGGTKVRVNERFELESTTAGTMVTVMRTTHTTVIDITRLDEIDSCYFRIANSATATMFLIYTDTVSVQILDAVQAEEMHWYTQPGSTDGLDCLIDSSTPTTNWGSATTISIGEDNLGASVQRTLFKYVDLDNFQNDPDLLGFQPSYAALNLRIQNDRSSFDRTFELFYLLVDFVESQATWNIRKTGVNWGTAGGQAGVDYNATPIASCFIGAAETGSTLKPFTFNAYGLGILQQILDGTLPNNGFLGKAQTENGDLWIFHSAEAAIPEYAPLFYMIGSIPGGQ